MQGVQFIENVDIQEINIIGENITELKSREHSYPVNQLVLACGAWSTKIVKMLDLNILIRWLR